MGREVMLPTRSIARWNGASLPSGVVDAGPIIVRGELNKDAAQVCLAKHDQVVDALPPDRADQSFRIAVLPWRTGRDRLVPIWRGVFFGAQKPPQKLAS